MVKSGWMIAAVLMAALASPVYAQDSITARSMKIEAALVEWAGGNGIKRYSIAVGHKGRIVHEAAAGQSPDAPAPLASLSKAITGACVLALEKAGLFSRGDTLDAILGKDHPLLSKNPKSRTITIVQLLTHSSGLSPDTTQGRMHNWLFAESNRIQKRAKEGLAANAISGTPDQFAYNNSNYAVLGAVIEHVTEKPYETACTEAVPAIHDHASVKVSKKWFALSAFGGWEASTADFLRFALKRFGPASNSQDDGWSPPSLALGGGAFYGPGVLYRKNRAKGYNIWHSGLLCNPDPNDDLGSFFAVWGSTWSVAVTFKKCVTFSQLIALDKSLVRAALR